MKRIVSISLGSSQRDHRAEVEVLGEKVVIQRIGADGDMKRAIGLFKELDGKVDAFGLGGIDLYLVAGKKRYTVRDAQKLVQAVKKTPIVDGSGLKDTLERRVIQELQAGGFSLAGKKVLMVSAVDRFGMAEAVTEAGCRVVFGDLIFALGVPIRITSLNTLRLVAHTLLPIVTRLPFKILYPTGGEQEKINVRFHRYYQAAEIIAGDFLLIKKYLPPDLSGKIILTNTVTESDLRELAARGVKTLITTTPDLSGRSFGTNVMEALLVAFSGRRPEEMTAGDYHELLERLRLKPRILELDSQMGK